MPQPASKSNKSFNITIGSPVSRRDLIDFCSLMGFVTREGIPLVQAMDIAGADCENKVLRATLGEVKALLEGGRTFAESLERHPRFFDFQFVGIIRAGERSGALDQAFDELKHYLEWQERTSNEVKQATIYPTIVLFVVALLVAVLFTFVVPTFAKLLRELKADMPASTKVVLGLGDFMKAHGVVVIPVLFGLPVAMRMAIKASPAVALRWDRVRLSLPVVGELTVMLCMMRFAHNLGILYRNGVSILQALQLAEKLVGSPWIERCLVEVRRSIEGGHSVSEALRKHPIFPTLLLRMVGVGEKVGALDRTLLSLSEYYGNLVTLRIKRMFQLLEPVIILSLIGIVGFVAISLLMPMITLMRKLGQA